LAKDGFDIEVVSVGVEDGCIIEVDVKQLPVEYGSPDCSDLSGIKREIG
jgi:hypothetical protein